MPVLAVVHSNQQLRASLRRGLPSPHVKVIGCRTTARVDRLLAAEVVDGIVFDVVRGDRRWFYDTLKNFPMVPGFAASAFRPDDGPLIGECLTAGADILVEGVDDAAAGELVGARSAGAIRWMHVADAPRLLRLREPVQLRVWSEIMGRAGDRLTTGELARVMGRSREHLSREFAAGGAPNLKRAIDLGRLICAADLLANPAYSISNVAAILRFASASHMGGCAQRLAGTTPAKLAELGPRGVLARFLKGRTRSRI